MRKSRALLGVAAVAALSLGAAACGDDDDEPTEGTTPAAVTTPDAGTVAEGTDAPAMTEAEGTDAPAMTAAAAETTTA